MSRAFGALCRPVFQDSTLSLKTKRSVSLWGRGMDKHESCHKEVS